MPIRFLDMFAGIGGFRSGLERLGGFECIGYCEIDKYAKQAYDAMYPTKGELYFADARTIDPYTLPDIDLICGGFPCQSFSIAGLRRGFQDDTRGTLFFEIARIAAVKRPPFLLLENVPGLLSHDKGRTFATILGALDELGYDVAWQILNSKDFGVPQSRKRVYIVGYLRERCAGEILSFTNANAASLIQLLGGTEGNRVYSDEGVGITLTSNAGGFGGKTGLYDVALPIKVDTKSGFQLAHPGDSIDLAYPTMNTRRGRVGEKIAHKTEHKIEGFFEYVVPPLEGFWWQDNVDGIDYADKAAFNWISVIRLPEFITQKDFEWAVETASEKKKLDCSSAEFLTVDEGLCVQIMHIGAFDDEPQTVTLMDEYIAQNGYENDITESRLHHEIYLSDARKVAPEKWKTVIRHPIKRSRQQS